MSTPAVLRKLLMLLMVVTLLPGLPELIETAEHLLHEGHLPHSAEHLLVGEAESHEDILDDEHGCTPMLHHCSCHASMPVLAPDASAQGEPQVSIADASERRTPSSTRGPVSRANAPPTPPPNA